MAAPDPGAALRLTKHHGAGNDFLVLLDPEDRRPLSAEEARALCDRHRGVGADGVLRAWRDRAGADLAMELRNADGGTAEMSGNGVRCLVQAAADAGLVQEGDVTVRTLGGLRTVQYRSGPGRGAGWGRVGMGPVTLGETFIPAEPPGTRWARHVTVGNPHVVLFGVPVDAAVVQRVGARLDDDTAGGANIEFAWPGPGAGELTVRVWERGVGETLACGTGACAAVAAAHDRGEVGPTTQVHSRGGPLEVALEDGEAVLAGPTQFVAALSVDGDVLAALAGVLDTGAAAGRAVPSEVARRP